MRQLQYFGIGLPKNRKMKELLRSDKYSNNNLLGTLKNVFAPTPEVAQQRREAVTSTLKTITGATTTNVTPTPKKTNTNWNPLTQMNYGPNVPRPSWVGPATGPIFTKPNINTAPIQYRILETPTEVAPSGLITKSVPSGVLMERRNTEYSQPVGYSTKDPTEFIRRQDPFNPIATTIGLNWVQQQQRNMQADDAALPELRANTDLKNKFIQYGQQYSNIKTEDKTPYARKGFDIPLTNIHVPGILTPWQKRQEVAGLANPLTHTITISPKYNTTEVKAHEYGHLIEQPITGQGLRELQGYFGPTQAAHENYYTKTSWQSELIPRGIEQIDSPKFKREAPTAYNEIRQNLQRYASTVDPTNPEYASVGMSIAPKYSIGTGYVLKN